MKWAFLWASTVLAIVGGLGQIASAEEVPKEALRHGKSKLKLISLFLSVCHLMTIETLRKIQDRSLATWILMYFLFVIGFEHFWVSFWVIFFENG